MLIRAPMPVSYLFGSVRWDVFRVLLVSLTFHLLKHFELIRLPQIPAQLSTILGTSISLLLAFNLNQSYERWWEARRIWGAIVNDSRHLILQLQAFVGRHEAGTVREFGLRQIAFCHCLVNALRGLEPMPAAAASVLAAGEREVALSQRNPPLALLSLHGRGLHRLREEGRIDSFQQAQVSATVGRLCDWMGMAERIKSTVFPITYRIYLHLFIYLFLVILSLSLVEPMGVLEVPVLTVVATTFFLLEKTATLMQDPFSNQPTDTAMSAIARNIEINLRQLIGDPQVPDPLQADGYYLM